MTSAHLASRMIYTAATSFDDVDERDILDLGCGCAILSIACVMMGAKWVERSSSSSSSSETGDG